MSTLAEIEQATEALPLEQQKELLDWLAFRVNRPGAAGERHSVLDIPTISLGGFLRTLSRDDDLLDEMLENRF